MFGALWFLELVVTTFVVHETYCISASYKLKNKHSHKL